MYQGSSSGYPSRKPLYPGAARSGPSSIPVHYTNQKVIRDKRTPVTKEKVSSSKVNSNYRQSFEPEENKYDHVNSVPYKRMQIGDVSSTDLEALRSRIEALEEDNRKKDMQINKLKAENGQLKSVNRVLQGKLKRRSDDEARERRIESTSNDYEAYRPPVSSNWAPSAKKMTGKFH